MKKLLLVGTIVIAAIYFLFLADPYPKKIEFQEVLLEFREDINNTLDKEFDIFNYRNISNHHIMIFGIRNNSVRTLKDFSNLYVTNFKRQGFNFNSGGSNHLGTKGDEAIYMTELKNIEGVVIYLKKSVNPKHRSTSDAESVFAELQYISF